MNKKETLLALIDELTMVTRSHACTVAARAFTPGAVSPGDVDEERRKLENAKEKLNEFINTEL